MMHTWTRVGLPALLAAVLTASPTFGQFDGELDKSQAILHELKGVTKSLQDLKNLPTTVTELEKKVSNLEKKLNEQLANQDMNTQLRIQDLRADLGTLREQQAQLKQELETLRSKLTPRPATTALYPPNGTANGRLRLRNTFLDEVSIVVNNRPAYRVPPGGEVWVEAVPAGLFTYEVLGIQPRLSRSLSAGETFTIHVYPR